MPKRDGQGETEANTKGGTEEAKGGENVQKINREDVVQAALTMERWCKKEECGDCPFLFIGGCVLSENVPKGWELEEHLRTRGLENGEV